jgi:hypothetical protein
LQEGISIAGIKHFAEQVNATAINLDDYDWKTAHARFPFNVENLDLEYSGDATSLLLVRKPEVTQHGIDQVDALLPLRRLEAISASEATRLRLEYVATMLAEERRQEAAGNTGEARAAQNVVLNDGPNIWEALRTQGRASHASTSQLSLTFAQRVPCSAHSLTTLAPASAQLPVA